MNQSERTTLDQVSKVVCYQCVKPIESKAELFFVKPPMVKRAKAVPVHEGCAAAYFEELGGQGKAYRMEDFKRSSRKANIFVAGLLAIPVVVVASAPDVFFQANLANLIALLGFTAVGGGFFVYGAAKRNKRLKELQTEYELPLSE